MLKVEKLDIAFKQVLSSLLTTLAADLFVVLADIRVPGSQNTR